MSKKKYIDFPSGIYDTTKIFLQADPITGELQKVYLPSLADVSKVYVDSNIEIINSNVSDEITARTNADTNLANIKADKTAFSNIDNTSDLDKPVSTATQAGLDIKVDKVSGKGLSTNDYDDTDKTKLTRLKQVIDTLPNTTGFSTYTPNAEVDEVVILDEVRGGRFVRYSGTLSPDGGCVFADATSQKWSRILENHINVRWYGADSAVTSVWANLILAVFSTDIGLRAPRIFFPEGTYWIQSTIVINNLIEIYGSGTTTLIRCSGAFNAIETSYINSRGTYLHDFVLQGVSSGISTSTPWGDDYNPTIHGVVPSDIIILENIQTQYFSGDGFHLYGSIGASSNINNSIINHCVAIQNRRHGFWIQGSDANQCKFINCDSRSNGGVGFYDNSFLGNQYLACHSATNGSPDTVWQRGIVQDDSANVYACLVDGTIGITPGVTSGWASNWVLVTGTTWSTFPSVRLYDNAETYYAVGAYNLINANQSGTMIGCYMEADQISCTVLGSNIVVGGNIFLKAGGGIIKGDSAGVYSGAFYAGNPGDYSQPIPYMVVGDGIYLRISSGRYFKIGYTSSGDFVTIGTAALTGGILASAWAFNYGFRMNHKENRGLYNNVDMGNIKPTGAGVLGDLILASNNGYQWESPEVLEYKYFGSNTDTGSSWVRVVGMAEFEFSTANATNFGVTKDYNRGQTAVQYEISTMCLNPATHDVFTEKRIVSVKGVYGITAMAVVQSTVLSSYIDSGLTGVSISVAVGMNASLVQVTGLAATTLNWKVRVKRIMM